MGTKKETGLVLDNKTTIPNAISAIDAQLAELTKITNCAPKTAWNLDGFGDLSKETKLENLIRAYSSIAGKEAAYHAAAKDLQLSIYPEFTINGANKENWLHDIKLRIAVIQHETKLNKLNEYKEKLAKFMTEEDQKAMLFKDMASFFGQE
jgi:hypothetical protein